MSRAVYERTYTTDEVIESIMKWQHPERGRWYHDDVDIARSSWREHLIRDMGGGPWVRRRVLVAELESRRKRDTCDSPEIAPYVARRLAGGRFPPIVLAEFRRPPVDGNHRLRAAQCVGDEYIDAFVPLRWASEIECEAPERSRKGRFA